MHLPYDEFRARFTDAEKVRIELASLHDATLPRDHASNIIAASLRALLADASAAGRVNLLSDRVQGGVKMLAAAGLLDAPAADRVAAILAVDGEVTGAPVGGYTLGQAVRVLPPFDAAYPEVYSIEGFGADAVLIAGGVAFSPSNVEAA